MKLPTLQEKKFNKRVGKETPIFRIYKTKAGDPMFFYKQRGLYCYYAKPYLFPQLCANTKWKELVSFQARICGVTEFGEI